MTSHSKKLLTTAFSLPCLLSLIGGGAAVHAQGLDSHVHGHAELNVVLAGQQLQIEFVSTAMNLLGFERAPNSTEETALVESVTEDLQTGEWLLGDALANCRMSTVTFEGPEFDGHAHEDEEHEHDDEHEDEHEEAHAEFHVQYLYDCQATPPKEFSISAFAQFSGIEEITVQWIAEGQQGLSELTANNPVLNLE